MAKDDQHDINFIRRELTAIEIELMPDHGEVTDVLKVDHYKRNINAKLEAIMIRLEGTN